MALSGVHIACAYLGGLTAQGEQTPLVGDIVWSQTMASAGVTSRAAPAQDAGHDTTFEIRSSVDIFVACGPNPDATRAVGANNPGRLDRSTSTARFLVPAGVTRNVFAYPGDRVAWVPA